MNMATTDEELAPFFYRDVAPIETISAAREILKELNLFPYEARWYQNGSSVYSVRLSCMNGHIGTNGKGLSREAALASAYAELLERLQNQLLNPRHTEILYDKSEFEEEDDFIYSKDEILIDANDEKLHDIKSILTSIGPVDNSSSFEYLGNFLSNEPYNKILCIPFEDVQSNSLVYLPLELIRYIYGSTGMCSGNSRDEALVQGLSEVIERHAIDLLAVEGRAPAILDISELELDSSIRTIIREINDSKKFSIEFRDCSLGLGLPVVAALFIKKSDGSYHVNLGCHPIMNEAFARSITETFQGREIDSYKDGVHIDFTGSPLANSDNCRTWDSNIIELIRTNNGYYPDSFHLSEAKSSDFQSLFVREADYNSRESFEYLCRLASSIVNTPVLVRDASFLGFHSYQVVVPGLAGRRYTMNDLRKYVRRRTTSGLLRNVTLHKKERIQDIINSLEENLSFDTNSYIRLSEFTTVLLNKHASWLKCPTLLFLAAAYLYNAEYSSSIQTLQRFLRNVNSQDHLSSINETPYRVMMDYISLRYLKKLEHDSVEERLSSYYDAQLVKNISSRLQDRSNAFVGLSMPVCPNCDQCSVSINCFHKDFLALTNIIRKRMSSD
jgi:ribosomal protein S12 methylthiotransferase accessory factor